MTHVVRSFDWSFTGAPGYEGRAEGLSSLALVDRHTGAVHTELDANRLAPGGRLAPHVCSFETAVYVLGGDPVLAIEDRCHRLPAGDYALLPVGTRHGFANPGASEARWLSVSTPQRLPAGAGRADTFFSAEAPGHELHVREAVAPDLADPTTRLVGHYAGTPPQAEALAVRDPARGRAPAGMDTALLAYSGISVKMLVDRGSGADLLTMFMVDYEVGGAAQAHDHPFEEAYVFLEGEIEAELDGEAYRLRAGDVAFAGVGSTHAFYNLGPGRVRWLETQAPQPPARHSYRWVEPWRRLAGRVGRRDDGPEAGPGDGRSAGPGDSHGDDG